MNPPMDPVLVRAVALAMVSGKAVWGSMDSFSKLDAMGQAEACLGTVLPVLEEHGYTRHRTITTLAELQELHAGTIALDAEGMLWKIDGSTDEWINIEDGESETYADEDLALPVRLWEPQQ